MPKISALFLAVPLTLIGCGDSGTNNPDSGVPSDGSVAECFDVQGSIEADGIMLERPREDSRGCEETGVGEDAYCTEVAPDFSCLGESDPLGTPTQVTFEGCVTAFGVDTQTQGLTISIFHETVGGQPIDPGYDIMGPTGNQTDNSPNALIGRVVSTEDTNCPDRGWFQIADVPTETPLIIRVTDQNVDRSSRTMVDTYKYNVILRNSGAVDPAGMPVADPSACTPATCTVIDEANAIAASTFIVTAQAAQVSRIPGQDDLHDGEGMGHVAGEVQDCSSRNTVQNASVTLDTEVIKLTYFNIGFGADGFWSYDDPKPQGGRRNTNADGLYTAIGVDTPAGGLAVKVGSAVTPTVCGPDGVCHCTADNKVNPEWSAADTGEGETKVLGTRTVFVYPDSITILTFDRNLYVDLQ